MAEGETIMKIKTIGTAMWAGFRMGVAATSMVLRGDSSWAVEAEFCSGLTLIKRHDDVKLFAKCDGIDMEIERNGIPIDGTKYGRPVFIAEAFGEDAFAGLTPEEAAGFRAMNDRINAKLLETQRIADANPLRKK